LLGSVVEIALHPTAFLQCCRCKSGARCLEFAQVGSNLLGELGIAQANLECPCDRFKK